MSLLMLDRNDAPGSDSADTAAETIDAFPYPFEHLGREFETVMGDVTLCCSTCCTCSSGGGRQQPR